MTFFNSAPVLEKSMRINERTSRKPKERACYSCGAEVPLSTLRSIDIMPEPNSCAPENAPNLRLVVSVVFYSPLATPRLDLGWMCSSGATDAAGWLRVVLSGHVEISSRESRSHFRFHYDVSSCFRGFDSNYRLWKLVVVVWTVYLQFLLEGTWCRFLRDVRLWRDLLKVGKVLMEFILRISFFFETVPNLEKKLCESSIEKLNVQIENSLKFERKENTLLCHWILDKSH